MSTRQSIKYKERCAEAPGYHLYNDLMDDFGGSGESSPVYLMLDGVHAEMATTDEGVVVTIVLPKATALELGLLPSNMSVRRMP